MPDQVSGAAVRSSSFSRLGCGRNPNCWRLDWLRCRARCPLKRIFKLPSRLKAELRAPNRLKAGLRTGRQDCLKHKQFHQVFIKRKNSNGCQDCVRTVEPFPAFRKAGKSSYRERLRSVSPQIPVSGCQQPEIQKRSDSSQCETCSLSFLSLICGDAACSGAEPVSPWRLSNALGIPDWL